MSSPPFDFASWPPALTQPQLEALTLYATSYALSHGLLYLPPADRQPVVPSSAIHAPVSLFPSPVPRKLFEQGQRIQRIYNVLYSRIAMDEEFLDEVMGAETGVGKVDDFIGQLWRGWRKLRDDGHAPVRCSSFDMSVFASHPVSCIDTPPGTVPLRLPPPFLTQPIIGDQAGGIQYDICFVWMSFAKGQRVA